MPAIIAWAMSALIAVVGTVVGRVIIALGIGYVEYKGFSILIDFVKDRVSSLMGAGSAGALMLSWMGFFRIDTMISIVFSAIGVKILLNGVTNGSLKSMIRK